ncbi:MAG: sugar transferase [bacterium]
MIRRGIDILVAGGLLVVAAPAMAVIATLNWIMTRRVFYAQPRVGRGLAPFVIVKFQTMTDGAPSTTVTARGDRRITPLGRLLRALKLDELPQLINVLRGEMSLVGPRPLTPNEVAAIPPALARQIYATSPGMTGIGTLAFLDEERRLGAYEDPEAAYFSIVLPQKAALEAAYAQRKTWLTDLVILALTPLAGCSGTLRRSVVTWLVPEGEGVSRHDNPAIAP